MAVPYKLPRGTRAAFNALQSGTSLLAYQAYFITDEGRIAVATSTSTSVDVATKAEVTAHIGSGGAAHANVVAGGAAGFMTGADKTKLDGVATGATANTGTVTDVTGTSPIVSSGGTAPAISISAATTGAAGSMSAADKTKLDGIAASATANSSDAVLLARANHTGTQAPSTILSAAASVLFGRYAATAGAGQEITIGSGLSLNTTTGVLTSTGSGPANTDALAEGTTNLYFTNARSIASPLTGLATPNTAVVATDSIVVGIGKAQGQITAHIGAGGAAHADVVAAGASGFMTGADKTKLNGIATGATNYTDADVRSTALTGYSVGANTALAGTDTILSAMGKIQGQINARGTGNGTVTSVSVTTAAGVSGSVATNTTTPAITITLGAISPTSVTTATINNATGVALQFNGATKLVTVTGGVNVTGAFTATGTITASSDRRLKKNVKTVENALEKVCFMRGVNFEWKKGSGNRGKSAGVIAQEHALIAPEAVHQGEDGYLTVNDAATTAYLIEAIKELRAIVDQQGQELAELRAR